MTPTSRDAKKDALLAALVDTRRQILAAASALPAKKRDEVFLGTWSVKDLLAHLEGWDFANIEAIGAIQGGRLPGFYAHQDRDWTSFNAMLVAQYGKTRFADLARDVRASHRQLIAALQAVPAYEFDRDRGLRAKGWIVTVARLMRAEHKDEQEHLKQVQEWTRG